MSLSLLIPCEQTVGFSYVKRERNHCKQPSTFPSSMCEFVTPHMIQLMSISFVNLFFSWSVCTEECKFLPKRADKRTTHTFVFVHLVCGLHIKPKFKAFLPSLCGFPELVEHNTSDPNNNSKQYNRQQVCKSYFKRK